MIKWFCSIGKLFVAKELLLMDKKKSFYVDIMALHPEVTGSCNIVTVNLPNGRRFHFIVDCGLFQDEKYNEYNKELPFSPFNIDFCLVTHAHIDHIGRFPLMVRKGFKGAIYTTDDTKEIMGMSLMDSARVIRESAKRKKNRPIYTETDVSDTMQLVIGCDFESPIRINDNIKVTFFNNGHLYGAAIIYIKISYPGEKPINLLFTGDYNEKNMFLDLSPLPNWLFYRPITIVQESTYGYMDSCDIERTFITNVTERIRKGGNVLIPVFSLGRMQEILYIIKVLQRQQKIPVEVPIYVDGKLGIKYTLMCKNGKFAIKDEMKGFLPENVVFVDKSTRQNVLDDNGCKIIITTSGMGSYGPAQVYIPAYITRRNTLIQFTGYVAEGTLGRKLKDTPKGEEVTIRGVLYKKRADVEYTSEFSAHAKANQMIDFLNKFKHLNLVLINHGETDSKETFAKRVLREVKPGNVAVLGRKYFFRINPYGLVGSKPTKFM